ncbi:hypothetical protein A2856_01435 [Candidatus Uhrbacteria bacterium RIFCSPHIGHO2_01_FULL_63_20]|uniref:Uncharacterized protein n=1 Tax=Candidatus Uhrbacteria bacterium RIFCSPHIGHO2_01_FULL_63_20 TaxID=1802385 RepID=A0A1F7TK63_9BACT|nr:MAG: hypothetical protein A2856_01435 [Candidatus Uhrbacteria bacterium RIFCSPHIGHO2_01_FULL_63_20]
MGDNKKQPSEFERLIDGTPLWAHLGQMKIEDRMGASEGSFIALAQKLDDTNTLLYLKACLALIRHLLKDDPDEQGRALAAFVVRTWPQIPEVRDGVGRLCEQDGSTTETYKIKNPCLLETKRLMLNTLMRRWGETKDAAEAAWLFAFLCSIKVLEHDQNGYEKRSGIVDDMFREACGRASVDRILQTLELGEDAGGAVDASKLEILALNLGRKAPTFVSEACRAWQQARPIDDRDMKPSPATRLSGRLLREVAALERLAESLVTAVGVKKDSYVSGPRIKEIAYPSLDRIDLTIEIHLPWHQPDEFKEKATDAFIELRTKAVAWQKGHEDIVVMLKGVVSGDPWFSKEPRFTDEKLIR